MAIMIPDIISKKSSDAEIKVFNWFKNDPCTSDWVVLHSLALDKHISLIQGEADFVVLAPKYGIFVLEVKGGRVCRENGKWKYIDRFNNITVKPRGPFEQASDCIFSIVDLLKDKYGSQSKIGNLLFSYGAIFPDIEFDYDSPEFNKRQVFDIRNGHEVGKFVINLSAFAKNKFKETYNFFDNEKMPTTSDIKNISSFLRPNFEVQISLLGQINNSEETINILTEEQYNTIDQISDNKRIMVLGGAGTGKTMMALHTLKKLLLSQEKKVALLCFNSNLGSWLERYVRDNIQNEDDVFVGSFHSFLRKIMVKAGMDAPSDWGSSSFYSDELFYKSLDAIEKTNIKYDVVLVDEFQDLFTNKVIDIFDAILVNGFKRGSWVLFADFRNQDIYVGRNLNENESIEQLEQITSFAKTRLTINCRNTVNISKEIENMVSVKYKSVINQVNGVPVSYKRYKNDSEQIEKIDYLLCDLINEGIKPNDIVLLSPRKYQESVVRNLKTTVSQYNLDNKGKIQFSTIHSFKGLEKKVIIVVDIQSYSQSKLIYIAFSRARTALYVFENENASRERANIIFEKVNKNER